MTTYYIATKCVCTVGVGIASAMGMKKPLIKLNASLQCFVCYSFCVLCDETDECGYIH